MKNLTVSCLLFADDLVLLARHPAGLATLMDKTRTYFHYHRLDISEEKSKIMTYEATTGKIHFQGTQTTSISLDQIISFKYLGVPISSAPYSLYKEFNDQVQRKARQYLASILSLVKRGPDRAELAYTLWSTCALPAILYGAEIIPLTKGTIKEVESCQNRVGKFILQLPSNSADIVANIDAGFRPIRGIIAEKVLTYASQTLKRPSSYWPRVAMGVNIELGNQVAYTRYLMSWKEEVKTNILSLSQIRRDTHRASINYVIREKQERPSVFAMNTPSPTSINRWFRKKNWVSDSCLSKIVCLFRSCNAGLGNRGPTKDGRSFKDCPLCAQNGLIAKNNEARKTVSST